MTLTLARYLHGGSIENIILGGVAFAVYLAIFIITQPSLCAIRAVPNRSIKVGHGAGCASLPRETTFLELGREFAVGQLCSESSIGRILWTQRKG